MAKIYYVILLFKWVLPIFTTYVILSSSFSNDIFLNIGVVSKKQFLFLSTNIYHILSKLTIFYTTRL